MEREMGRPLRVVGRALMNRRGFVAGGPSGDNGLCESIRCSRKGEVK